MATSAAFNVGASAAVQIATGLKTVLVQNLGGAVGWPIFLGGSGVSKSNGLRLDPSMAPLPMPIGLLALESLYAILDSDAGTDTCDVRVLTYTG